MPVDLLLQVELHNGLVEVLRPRTRRERANTVLTLSRNFLALAIQRQVATRPKVILLNPENRSFFHFGKRRDLLLRRLPLVYDVVAWPW